MQPAALSSKEAINLSLGALYSRPGLKINRPNRPDGKKSCCHYFFISYYHQTHQTRNSGV